MQWTRIPDPGEVKTLPVTLHHENKSEQAQAVRDDLHLIHFILLSLTCKYFKFVVIASLYFTLFGAN